MFFFFFFPKEQFKMPIFDIYKFELFTKASLGDFGINLTSVKIIPFLIFPATE